MRREKSKPNFSVDYVPREFTYDSKSDAFTLFGVRYFVGVFETIANAPAGTVFKFIRRADGHMEISSESHNAA